MAADSSVPAPELFDLQGIMEVEREEMEKTKLELMDGVGGAKGASICGPFGVDQAIMNALEAAKESRVGGMATRGDSIDRPHIICITGDGATLTHGTSGVRIGIFCGSTEFLNQSTSDVTDLVMYQVCLLLVVPSCLSSS